MLSNTRLESQLSRMNCQTFSWGVQLGALRWQRDDRNVIRHRELAREVPAGLIEQQYRVASGRDIGGDRREVQVHHLGVAPGQDQADSLALFGADGAEDVGGVSTATWN